MCKCLQNCLETCYWHLIEKRFCYDESIALYDVPVVHEKEEKNNNFFDNLAFYDCVAVIAGRAIVTIDPLPSPKEKPIIVQQPTKRLQMLQWDEEQHLHPQQKSRSAPVIYEITEEIEDIAENKAANASSEDITDFGATKSVMNLLKPEGLETPVEIRRKSLRERRMSKSLYLKIEHPKELPIIRQQSMPKFYLDTPDADEIAQFSIYSPATAFSPVPKSSGFVYDLHSVVQMERDRVQSLNSLAPVHRKESERSSRLMLIREKIKLRRAKSSVSGSIANLPHSHHHI